VVARLCAASQIQSSAAASRPAKRATVVFSWLLVMALGESLKRRVLDWFFLN
jgi:hypothetical protein